MSRGHAVETLIRMDERELEDGEEVIDESGRNLTQQEIDERGPSKAPVDTEWEAGDE